MRASSWRKRLCPNSPYPSLTIVPSKYSDQISIDVPRTSDNPWFLPHEKTLCGILNTFANVNKSFGYAQGLNFIAFPLFYVFYNDDPKTAVENTFYALHSVVRTVLPFYPLDANDTSALEFIRTVASTVRLRCVEMDPSLYIIFEQDYIQFVESLVSATVPVLYSNTFKLEDTLLLWDDFFETNSNKELLEKCVHVLSRCIVSQRNVFLHLRLDKCMAAFHRLLACCIGVVH